ncbi:Eukaryotic translation elongation factor 1 epsilon-1 [Dissostichus eleginoides]|uniref:Eukaryotic translation elongation factor 1 epsilon-1 n=1 Tax=Dissostichus eleginoides TaxID=100907 RepID=A0AAD9F1F2_DISEL|nr:Eukaryotic translation elongation factor 1 epsilon-1 [Dissostichus eleginoides]
MALRELSSLEKYLGLKKPNKYSTQGDKKVPVLQNNNGPPLVGLGTIASHLWLEYRVTKLDGCTKEDTKAILKDLNLYLQDKVYMAGNQFTLADTFMYFGIHPIIVDLSVQEKEQYVNVARWFDHIQRCPGVRHHLPPLVVLRNRIYTSKHH